MNLPIMQQIIFNKTYGINCSDLDKYIRLIHILHITNRHDVVELLPIMLRILINLLHLKRQDIGLFTVLYRSVHLWWMTSTFQESRCMALSSPSPQRFVRNSRFQWGQLVYHQYGVQSCAPYVRSLANNFPLIACDFLCAIWLSNISEKLLCIALYINAVT